MAAYQAPGKNTGVGCHSLLQCMKVKIESEVAQLCPTLRDSMYCSLPGSSVHGILPGKSTGVGCHCLLHYTPERTSIIAQCQVRWILCTQAGPRAIREKIGGKLLLKMGDSQGSCPGQSGFRSKINSAQSPGPQSSQTSVSGDAEILHPSLWKEQDFS